MDFSSMQHQRASIAQDAPPFSIDLPAGLPMSLVTCLVNKFMGDAPSDAKSSNDERAVKVQADTAKASQSSFKEGEQGPGSSSL